MSAYPSTARLAACVGEALSVSVPGCALSLRVYQGGAESFHVASTLVMGERDAVLVDAQFTLADAHRVAAIVLASGRRLKAIYISHGDPDFYFGLDVLRQAFPGVPVWATPQTVAYIRASATDKIGFWRPQFGTNQPANAVLPQPLAQPLIELEGQRLEVFGWGGPLPTHTCLWIPGLRAAVGGVLAYSDAHGFMADVQTRGGREAWIAALERIEALEPAWVIPTHAGPGSPVDVRVLDFARRYITAFEDELPRRADAAALIAAMTRRFPQAALPLALEIGAKVLKGEMPWPVQAALEEAGR